MCWVERASKVSRARPEGAWEGSGCLHLPEGLNGVKCARKPEESCLGKNSREMGRKGHHGGSHQVSCGWMEGLTRRG